MNFCPFCGSSSIEKDINFIKCQNCHQTFYINSKPTASVIPVFKEEVLLGIRKDEPEKGKLDILGGFLKNGEDPEDGAIRELKEESDIDIKKEDLIFLGIWVDKYQYQSQHYFTFNVIYYILLLEKPNAKAGDDIGDLKWVNINSSPELAFKTQNQSIEKLKKILTNLAI